eukprot:3811484-Rhodomonas_salina.2
MLPCDVKERRTSSSAFWGILGVATSLDVMTADTFWILVGDNLFHGGCVGCRTRATHAGHTLASIRMQ